jgi:hypothetical protein
MEIEFDVNVLNDTRIRAQENTLLRQESEVNLSAKRNSVTLKSNTENANFGQAYCIRSYIVRGTDICISLKSK